MQDPDVHVVSGNLCGPPKRRAELTSGSMSVLGQHVFCGKGLQKACIWELGLVPSWPFRVSVLGFTASRSCWVRSHGGIPDSVN